MRFSIFSHDIRRPRKPAHEVGEITASIYESLKTVVKNGLQLHELSSTASLRQPEVASMARAERFCVKKKYRRLFLQSYKKSQQDALFLNFILVKNSILQICDNSVPAQNISGETFKKDFEVL